MLSVYLRDGPEFLRIQLIGALAAESAAAVEGAFVIGQSAAGTRPVVFDLTEVKSIDSHGQSLLKRAAGRDARFVTASGAGEAAVGNLAGLTPLLLPPPQLSAVGTLRCWVGRALGCVQPSIRKCLACGCMVRRLWLHREAVTSFAIRSPAPR